MFLNRIFKIIIPALFFSASCLKAQDTLNAGLIEQRSYQLFTDKNWNGLIKYGKMAIEKGYDYFYIQMRVGIAYYEKKNYALAEAYFKRALRFSSDDELALEYLYYCYLFNGRFEDAGKLSKRFGKDLAEKTATNKQMPVTYFMVEGGTKISDSSSYYDKNKKTSSNYFNPATYFQLGLGHHIKQNVTFSHAFSFYSQKNFVGSLKQLQYYLKAAIPLKNNWLISPALDVVNVNFTSVIAPTVTPPFQGPPPRTQTVTSSSNYFVGSFSVQKIVKRFSVSLGSTVSNMSGQTQLIHNAFASYSVFGNPKLVLGCTAYLHTANSYSTTNVAASPFVYVQPINRLSFKLGYFLNSGHNIVEDNGYFVNNSPDLTSQRLSFLANCHINKHLSIYGLYQMEFKEEAVQKFNYRYNIIVAGIKIIP